MFPEGQYNFPHHAKVRKIVFWRTPQLKGSMEVAEGDLDWNIYHRVSVELYSFWIPRSNPSNLSNLSLTSHACVEGQLRIGKNPV